MKSVVGVNWFLVCVESFSPRSWIVICIHSTSSIHGKISCLIFYFLILYLFLRTYMFVYLFHSKQIQQIPQVFLQPTSWIFFKYNFLFAYFIFVFAYLYACLFVSQQTDSTNTSSLPSTNFVNLLQASSGNQDNTHQELFFI